ncbi:Mitochondrial presequence protease [Pseudocyphellaria aurata]|nr:Mitochondrial presequence protease [Pseudocyphellaria aurata]
MYPMHLLRRAPRRLVRAKSFFPSSLGRRKLATLSDLPKRGEKLHGFTLERAKHIPELQLTAYHFNHDRTGAEYLHIARDDKNNVFSIGFKTNPPDHTGVPHILEHTTLCGSEKYPVRDPFFKMLPRSLANFMNAFTSADHTAYPFATTNRKDFSNLMSVYMDATLHPLLNESDFAQEGWRIGPENPLAAADGATGGSDSKLVFKGVVYNEMKGQMSDASYLFYTRFQDHIFPDINNSGGDPQKMTNLTYQDLKEFHARHYHPSNAKIFTYGDIPHADLLTDVNQQLDHFEKIRVDNHIQTPINLRDGPLEFTVAGPVDPLVAKDMQHKTSISWLVGDTANILENFSLSIMASLLLDGYGSPLYRNLIEAGLGLDWSPNTGYDNGGKEGIFSVGLSGVKKGDVSKVKEAVRSTVLEVYRQGFDKGKIDGILHQLEITLKHKTATFGMRLMQRLQSGWFNGVDPINALAWDETITAFKHAFAEDGYLEGLLKKYLLNDNTLTFTMEPLESYGENLASEETERLARKLSEVSVQVGGELEARKHLTARELELVDAQDRARSQDLSCLPTVHIKDIPRELVSKQVRDSLLGDTRVQWREADTNGLTYFRAINTLEGLPTDLRMLIPLFNNAIMRLGTKQKSVEEIEDLIKLKTGGIGVSYRAATSPTDLKRATEGLMFAGSALDKNISEMYEILRMILQETNFDGSDARSRIHELLQSDANGALDAIANSGNSYARRYAETNLTSQGLLNEQSSGLTHIHYYTTLARRSPSEGMDDIISKLKAIQQFAISNSSNLRTALTCGREATSSNEATLQTFLSNLPSSNSIPASPADLAPDIFTSKTFIPVPYQVYYSALALPTVPYVHPDSAPLQILSQLLTHKHLHHEIREKGGAYGGGAYAQGVGGTFGFYSYRDPNPENTLKIMHDAGRWAQMKEWSSQDIEEAKISVFQGLDAPKSVSEEGMTRFLMGINPEMEQRKREQLLDVQIKDIQGVAQKYLVDDLGKATVAILGERKEWLDEREGWHVKNIQMVEASADAPEAAAQRS